MPVKPLPTTFFGSFWDKLLKAREFSQSTISSPRFWVSSSASGRLVRTKTSLSTISLVEMLLSTDLGDFLERVCPNGDLPRGDVIFQILQLILYAFLALSNSTLARGITSCSPAAVNTVIFFPGSGFLTYILFMDQGFCAPGIYYHLRGFSCHPSHKITRGRGNSNCSELSGIIHNWPFAVE